jgi:uncharacterized phage protein gp47/JayE
MALSVQQITTPPTQAEVAQWIIDTLQDFGLQTTGWQPGRVQLTIVNMIARVASGFGYIIASTARATQLVSATGPALDAYALNRFDETRADAQKTAGPFTLTNSGTLPHTIGIGDLLFESSSGIQYQNTEAMTLAAGPGTVDTIDVEAVLAGAAGNIANDATIALVTPLAGVSVTNPSPGTDGSGDPLPWYSLRTGADPETDAQLREACSTKWGLLAVEKTSTAVKHLALSVDGVAKVALNDANPRGAGTVDVYVAASSALVSTAEITAAQELFAEATFQTEDVWPPTNSPNQSSYELKHPSTLEIAPASVVYYDPQYSEAEVKTRLSDRLQAFYESIPIGGKSYLPGLANVVTLGDLLQTIEGTRGVQTATLTYPTGNVSVGSYQLVTQPADWFALLTLTAVES